MSAPRLLIFEGMDSTGKTSLAKYFARKLNGVYFHASGHKTLYEGMQAHHMNILEAAEVNLQNGHHVILDRHWPSEHVYASVLRPMMVGKYNFPRVLERLDPLKPTYIYCCPDSVSEAWVRYQETHEGHDDKVYRRLQSEDYFSIGLEYQVLFDNVPHHRYTIETHGSELDKFVEGVIDAVR